MNLFHPLLPGFSLFLLEDRVLHKEAWVAKLPGTQLSIQVYKGQILKKRCLVLGH